MKKCKCKIKDHYMIICDKGVICCKCNKWIGKVRSTFYKRVRVKGNIKKYNRQREKREVDK